MESEEEEGISETGDTVEEGKEVEDIYHDAMEEAGKEENAETIREEDKSSRANLEEGRSRSETKKELVNHPRRTRLSQDSTSPDKTGCLVGKTVKSIEKWDEHCRKYKHGMCVL